MGYFSRLQIFSIMAIALILLTGCDKVFSQSKGVCITGYNEYDRKIHEFWLDSEGESGCFGNPSGRSPGYDFGGGGGFACGCKLTPGKEVDLEWEMVLTWDEYERGIPAETHKKKVVIPKLNGPYPRYFRVYFMRDGNPKLQWAEAMTPRLAPSQIKEVEK